MFYDNFTEDQICGLYTPWHFFAIAIFFISLAFVLFFTRKINQKQRKVALLTIAIIVTVLEIVKIIIRIYKHESGDAWIPLYFCSMFLFTIWFVFAKNKYVSTLGKVMVVFGGLFPSLCYILYPSTSLMILPIWHPGSIHSLIYHWLMLYSSCLILKEYKPKAIHFVYYFSFVTIFTAIAAIVNHFLGTNMMFLSNPFGLEILQSIFNYSKHLYASLAYFAQAVILFWLQFGIFKLIELIYKKLKGRTKTKKDEVKENECI